MFLYREREKERICVLVVENGEKCDDEGWKRTCVYIVSVRN